MINRTEKRKLERQKAAIVKKAKQDMQEFVDSLDRMPTEQEIVAWQAGYISGINRMSEVED
jgi:hypothetical protein